MLVDPLQLVVQVISQVPAGLDKLQIHPISADRRGWGLFLLKSTIISFVFFTHKSVNRVRILLLPSILHTHDYGRVT